jgi:uncharacterized protein YdaU (DUF1376 family)
MSRPRAFLFDVDAWLSSYQVERMSGEAVKAFIYLLCRAWRETPIATLPNDDEELARMVRLSLDEWNQVKPDVLAQFRMNGNGRIYNEKQKKMLTFCRNKSAAGAAGWTEKRRQKQAETLKQRTKQRTEHKP